jgi:2'-5' RNA ligase
VQTDKLQYRRLFIALEIPEDAKTKLFSFRDAVHLNEKYRWEVKDKIHLTINFIGDVKEEKIPLIKNVIDEVLRFKLSFARSQNLDFFPRLEIQKYFLQDCRLIVFLIK